MAVTKKKYVLSRLFDNHYLTENLGHTHSVEAAKHFTVLEIQDLPESILSTHHLIELVSK